MELTAALQLDIEAWKELGLERRLRDLDHSAGVHVLLDGRSVLSLGSNNYLGLAGSPALGLAAKRALDRVGFGAGGARLTTGNFPEHAALEREIAAWKGTEDAVLFDSGFAANTGVIPALAGKEDLILSDALNHASLIDGCRLSGATIRVYPHRDLDAVRARLKDAARFRRRVVVTDGVFSMDGDLAPLAELCAVSEEYDAWMVVDDAHGGGVLGAEGRGLADLAGVTSRIPVHIGTLSKAIGAAGGFAAGSAVLCQFLRHAARSFVYSTAMPPCVAAAAIEGITIARSADSLREQLRVNGESIRRIFRESGFAVPDGESPIIPIPVGDEAAASRLSEALLLEGIWIPSIRYPTVPKGQARLRVTASAALTSHDLAWLANALHNIRRHGR